MGRLMGGCPLGWGVSRAVPRPWFGVAWFGWFKVAPSWALFIALVNLVGIAYGFYYYAPQFAQTPPALWPLVPDSPLAVLWAELALAAYWLHRWRAGRGEAAGEAPGVVAASLDALAFVGNVQVGLWTVYVLLAYADSFGTFTLNLNTVLLAGHAGMAVLALVYVAGLRARAALRPGVQWVGIGVAAAYYLVQDAVDYFGPDFLGKGCGLRPHTVPCDAALEPILAAVTFGLTLASVGLLAALVRPRGGGQGVTRPRGDS